jgi:hypothetical protein
VAAFEKFHVSHEDRVDLADRHLGVFKGGAHCLVDKFNLVHIMTASGMICLPAAYYRNISFHVFLLLAPEDDDTLVLPAKAAVALGNRNIHIRDLVFAGPSHHLQGRLGRPVEPHDVCRDSRQQPT